MTKIMFQISINRLLVATISLIYLFAILIDGWEIFVGQTLIINQDNISSECLELSRISFYSGICQGFFHIIMYFCLIYSLFILSAKDKLFGNYMTMKRETRVTSSIYVMGWFLRLILTIIYIGVMFNKFGDNSCSIFLMEIIRISYIFKIIGLICLATI